MKQNKLPKVKFIGNISLSRRLNPIVRLYTSNDKYFIFDVVVNTKFKEYYAYEVTQDNLTDFLENENNAALVPKKNQPIFRVHFFDYSILEEEKFNKAKHDSSFYDDEFVCVDSTKIFNNIKNRKENEQLFSSI